MTEHQIYGEHKKSKQPQFKFWAENIWMLLLAKSPL